MIKEQLKLPARFAKFAIKVATSVSTFKNIKSIDDNNQIVKWLKLSE